MSDEGIVETWKNKDGKTIDAELIGFDRTTKRVHWKLPGNEEGSSLLDSLSYKSKWKALADPDVSYELGWLAGHYTKNEFTRVVPVFLFLAGGILALVALDYGCFRLGLFFVGRYSDRNFHAYLKQLLASIVTIVIVGLFMGLLAAFSLKPVSELTIEVSIGIAALLVTALVVSHHYEIGYGRGLGVMVLSRMTLKAAFAIASFSLAWTIDPLVLKPLGMI